MSKSRKTFTTQEKIAVLKEVDQKGKAAALRKYNIPANAVSRWRNELRSTEAKGEEKISRHDKLIIESLQSEIARLNQIITQQTDTSKSKEQHPTKEHAERGKGQELLRFVAVTIVNKVFEEFGEPLIDLTEYQVEPKASKSK